MPVNITASRASTSRLCVFSPFSDLYGAPRSLLAVLRGVLARDERWRIEAYTPEWGPLADALAQMPRTCVRTITYDLSGGEELSAAWRRPWRLIGRLAGRMVALASLARRVRGASVMYVNSLRGATAAWAAWIVGVPVVWHIRGTEAGYSFPVFRRFRLWSVRSVAHRAVAVSGAVARQLVEAGVPAPRITTVYNGVCVDEIRRERDPAAVEALRSRLIEGQDGPLILTLGRLRPDKGILDVLEMARVLAGSHGFTLAAVGGPVGNENPDWRRIERLARGVPGTCRVILEPYTDRPLDYLAASDVYLLLSHDEGFNRTILEAMALAKPCVVSRVGGNAEAVDDGRTGLTVPPHDPVAAASAVAGLIGDSALRQRWGEAGRERVSRLFTVSRMCDSMHAILVDAAQRGRP